MNTDSERRLHFAMLVYFAMSFGFCLVSVAWWCIGIVLEAATTQ
jgi:hypothetical protein